MNTNNDTVSTTESADEAIARFRVLVETSTPEDPATASKLFAEVLGLEIKPRIPGLSPDELERLAVLAEECGEVIQIVGKILRHGYASHNPYDPEKKTNRQLLETELGDLRLAITMMTTAYDVEEEFIVTRAIVKAGKIGKYLHHQNVRIKG